MVSNLDNNLNLGFYKKPAQEKKNATTTLTLHYKLKS